MRPAGARRPLAPSPGNWVTEQLLSTSPGEGEVSQGGRGAATPPPFLLEPLTPLSA